MQRPHSPRSYTATPWPQVYGKVRVFGGLKGHWPESETFGIARIRWNEYKEVTLSTTDVVVR